MIYLATHGKYSMIRNFLSFEVNLRGPNKPLNKHTGSPVAFNSKNFKAISPKTVGGKSLNTCQKSCTYKKKINKFWYLRYYHFICLYIYTYIHTYTHDSNNRYINFQTIILQRVLYRYFVTFIFTCINVLINVNWCTYLYINLLFHT
jgi:hypothetical protein